MVLGANLRSIKKDAATDIYKQNSSAGNINPIASYNRITGDDEWLGVGYDEEVVRRTLEKNTNDLLEAPSSPEVFEKFLCKKLKEPM